MHGAGGGGFAEAAHRDPDFRVEGEGGEAVELEGVAGVDTRQRAQRVVVVENGDLEPAFGRRHIGTVGGCAEGDVEDAVALDQAVVEDGDGDGFYSGLVRAPTDGAGGFGVVGPGGGFVGPGAGSPSDLGGPARAGAEEAFHRDDDLPGGIVLGDGQFEIVEADLVGGVGPVDEEPGFLPVGRIDRDVVGAAGFEKAEGVGPLVLGRADPVEFGQVGDFRSQIDADAELDRAAVAIAHAQASVVGGRVTVPQGTAAKETAVHGLAGLLGGTGVVRPKGGPGSAPGGGFGKVVIGRGVRDRQGEAAGGAVGRIDRDEEGLPVGDGELHVAVVAAGGGVRVVVVRRHRSQAGEIGTLIDGDAGVAVGCLGVDLDRVVEGCHPFEPDGVRGGQAGVGRFARLGGGQQVGGEGGEGSLAKEAGAVEGVVERSDRRTAEGGRQVGPTGDDGAGKDGGVGRIE